MELPQDKHAVLRIMARPSNVISPEGFTLIELPAAEL